MGVYFCDNKEKKAFLSAFCTRKRSNERPSTLARDEISCFKKI